MNFFINNANSDRLRHDCKPCHMAEVKKSISKQTPEQKRKIERNKSRYLLRVWLKEMKVAKGCVDCGYNKSPYALDLDHRPGEEKRLGISEFMRRVSAVDEIRAEIAKCDVVCANCHRVRTASRRVLLP